MSRFAIIMAGGSGTRFWPKSSAKKPKQLLSLTGKRSQLQLTWDRLQGLIEKKNRWVVGTEMLAAATRKQLPGVTILAEPEGRNTMAAVCWSAWAVAARDAGALVTVLPADAYVANVEGFKEALANAFHVAETYGEIVCLGIKPSYPATGYGYIKGREARPDGSRPIDSFVEKPNETVAHEFFNSGDYFWNAGIFVFKAGVFQEETRKHAPEFAAFFDKNISSLKKLKAGYKKLPKVAVDIALMEKTKRGALVPGDFGWNDIGAWPALAEVLPANSPAGIVNAKAGHASVDSEGCVVDVTEGKFVGLVGVKDLVVVETKDALLVCHKDQAQKIKDLVGEIQKNKKLAKKLL